MLEKLLSCLASPKRQKRKPPAPKHRTRRSRQNVKRVVMLGVGGAGKTTLFKQLSSPSWTNRDVQMMKSVVHGNVIMSIKALTKGARDLAITHPELRTAIGPETAAARSARFVLESLQDDEPLKPSAGRNIARLWNDPAIRRTYETRSQFGIRVPESCAYVLDRVTTICEYSYVPTSADYLRCSVRSTGISEAMVDLAGTLVQFLDIGGQRSERAKWINCFHNVCAVVYVVSLGDFDECVSEDATKNRLKESLAVFEELVNSRYCANIPVVLVFTKVDLLANVMKRCRLSDLFPQLKGVSEPAVAVSFFKKLYLSKVTRPGPSQVNLLTCVAIDRNSANMTLTTIKDIVTFSANASASF